MGDNELLQKLSRAANLFRELNLSQIEKIINACEKVSLDADSVLFKEGSRERDVYILLSGTMKALSRNEQVLITRIKPIRVIGEIGMLLGMPRTATIIAEEFVQLLKLPKDKIDALLLRDIDMERKLYRNLCNILCERLVSNNIQIEDYALPAAGEDRSGFDEAV